MSTKHRKILGEFIRQRRIQVGLTQKNVAKAFDYSTPQFISNWERGVSLPPLEHLPKLARLLKLSYDRLVEALFTCKELELEGERQAVLKRRLRSIA